MYYIGLKLIKTRIHFNNGLSDYRSTFIEITLWKMSDIKTN